MQTRQKLMSTVASNKHERRHQQWPSQANSDRRAVDKTCIKIHRTCTDAHEWNQTAHVAAIENEPGPMNVIDTITILDRELQLTR